MTDVLHFVLVGIVYPFLAGIGVGFLLYCFFKR